MTSNDLQTKVLIVDDEPEICSIMSTLININSNNGTSIEDAENGHQARQLLAKMSFDIVFLDIMLPDFNGVEILKFIMQHHPETMVVMMTGYPTLESSIDCMRLGAMDYLVKPFATKEVKNVFNKAEKRILQKHKVSPALQDEKKRESIKGKIIGESRAIKEVKTKIDRIAATDSTVLITGESGTGKDLIANTIHELSTRREFDFVPVDCSALVESLLESELFGHTKGAFTGADEIKVGLFERVRLFYDTPKKH